VGARARTLLERVSERVLRLPPQQAPAFGRVHLEHVRCEGEVVPFADVLQLARAHPLTDVGEFLARLRMLGMEGGSEAAAARAAECFRASYAAEDATVRPDFGAFEALSLVRLACGAARGVRREVAVAALLCGAEQALGAD
jgi:hypothetical protein